MSTISLRMRPDLVIQAQGRGDNRHWIVQDPVALRYFHLREEECSILQMLDGRTTPGQIVRQFERVFAPLTLNARQLQAFLFRLHELGLVVSDAPGQAEVLRKRGDAARRSAILAALANPLAIRLPGVAAGPLVDWLYPGVRWVFSPLSLVICTLLVAAATGLVVLQFGAFQARLPDWQSFFSAQSAAWFVVVLVLVKTLHELGHAMTCRHLGGNCREVGVLLLVFSPTLYCDVSDAWRIESKWRRIAVSSAGMLVELVLASFATLLWWFSAPGLLHELSLRVMFLCSVTTVLFNANPLLRCDGYYILSDLIEVPNLWQESRALLKRTAANWLLGMNLPEDPTLPRRMHWPLLAYAVASMVYSLLLVTAILWFCFRIAEPQGLASLALALAVLVIGSVVIPPVQGLYRLFSRPSQRHGWRRGRAMSTMVVLFAVLAFVLLVPLPHRIAAPLWLEAKDATPIYVSVPGRLADALPLGTKVSAGQTLATLSSPEVAQHLAELTAEVSQEQLRLKNLRLLMSDDPTAAPLVPAAEKSLADAQQRLAQWRQDEQQLRLVAPQAGTVLPPPAISPPQESSRLTGWRGTPLDRPNRGCHLETGTLVCLVGDPARLEALLVIEQAEVAFIRVGQRVRMRLEQGPVAVLSGTIVELARANADDLPDQLAEALDLPLQQSGRAGVRTVHTYYQARVELDPHQDPLAIGLTGDAKILADWQPLASRFLRFLQQTFRLS